MKRIEANQLWRDKHSHTRAPVMICILGKMNANCWKVMDLSTERMELFPTNHIKKNYAYMRDYKPE